MSRSVPRNYSSLFAAAALSASLALGTCPMVFGQSTQPVAAVNTASLSGAVVPDGTLIHITLLKDLKSGGNKSGEEIPFEVAKDVFGPGHTLLIPAQTQAFGKVIESSRRGIFGKSGKLKFTIDYVLAADKTHIPLRADAQLIRGRDNRTTAIATAILFAPIAMFINGKDVTAKKGQDFTMYVDAPGIQQPAMIAPPQTTAVATSSQAKSLFLLTNGSQVIGILSSFDGSLYTVTTESGTQTFKASEVKSVYALVTTLR